MNKRAVRIILAISGIVLIAIGGFVFVEYLDNRSLSGATVAVPLPPTILSLDGSVVHFDCLDTSKCFADVDLSAQIRAMSNPDERLIRLESAYYGKNTMLYMIISGTMREYLAKINPETGEVQILDLMGPPSLVEGVEPGMVSMIQGKMVLATLDGKISVVQDDFSVKAITNLKAPILDFIETEDSRIVAISTSGLLQNGSSQIKLFLVDINSGDIKEMILSGPSGEEWFFVTIDQNVKHLYFKPAQSKLLNVFDLQTQRTTLSIPISSFDEQAYSTQSYKRYQYHDMWYYSRSMNFSEGSYPALFINMATLKPVVNPQGLLKGETAATFMIAPFGDNFLIGMNSRVLLVSPRGMIIRTYRLPQEWIGRSYVLLEYKK
jgi:hypothetical protein